MFVGMNLVWEELGARRDKVARENINYCIVIMFIELTNVGYVVLKEVNEETILRMCLDV